MKKKIVLPSLFVCSFLVGLTPKTSKAGSIETTHGQKIDSAAYNLNFDSCHYLRQNQEHDSITSFNSASQQNDSKDSVSYTISWQGSKWVKYTSNDGSGFIRTGGSRTWRNMNPGAIRHGSFSKQYGACGSAGGFAVFPTEEQGMKALYALLQSDKYANLTIAAAVRKYAPSSDNNNPKSYQQKLSRMTGVSPIKRLGQLSATEISRVALAIKIIEGWKSGRNEKFNKRNSETTLALISEHMKQKQYND